MGSLPNQVVVSATDQLRATLALPGLSKLVACYFEPSGKFAAMTFTEVGANPPDEITTDDLLAVALLDITWRPLAVRALLGTKRTEISSLLVDICAERDLWEASDELMQKIDKLWNALRQITGVGNTTAAKLLARKRPKLCPLTDSVVRKAIGAPGSTWDVIRLLTQDPEARAEIEALRPATASRASLLRILDVAIWMLHSQSKAARKARAETGVSLRS